MNDYEQECLRRERKLYKSLDRLEPNERQALADGLDRNDPRAYQIVLLRFDTLGISTEAFITALRQPGSLSEGVKEQEQKEAQRERKNGYEHQ